MTQHRGATQKPEGRLGIHVIFFVGLVIKAVFVVIACFMVASETVFSPFNPFSLGYFASTLVLGSLLSGLVVGFLTRERFRGAWLSFSAAILATLLILTPLSWLFLFPPGIALVILGLMFDIIALVGGVIGASMKVKSMKLAVLVVLVVFTLIPVHAFISSPITVHVGDLVIKGNQIFTIEDRVYHQAGNIIVKDNATLVFRNADLIIDQRQEEHQITIENMARMVAENSKFTVITRNRIQRARSTSWIYVEDFASLLLNKSSTPAIRIVARQAGNVTMIGSKWDHWVKIYDHSHIFVVNSSIGSLSSYDSADISCENSIVIRYNTFGSSRLFLRNCNKIGAYIHTYGSIHAYDLAYAKLENSTIDSYLTHASQNEIYFDNATINNTISIDGSSNLYFHGNVTVKGSIEEFEGQLGRNYTVITYPNFYLNVTNKELDSLLWEGQSNNYGYATFNITFTPMNFTHNLLLNNEKDFNVTSSTPLKTH